MRNDRGTRLRRNSGFALKEFAERILWHLVAGESLVQVLRSVKDGKSGYGSAVYFAAGPCCDTSFEYLEWKGEFPNGIHKL